MNLQSLNLARTASLLMKTYPILLMRLGVTLLFWLVALIYFAVVGTVAFLIGNAIPILGLIVFVLALGGLGGLYHLAHRYVFYLLKAAHIVVISDLIAHGKLQTKVGQLAYGKAQVQERFGELSAMFVVDELVSGVVLSFTRTVYRINRWIPGNSETLEMLVRVINRIIYYSTNYIDEAILARSFYEQTDGDIWENARDAVILYGMTWKPILMNAIALMVLSYVPFIVALVIFALPIGLLVATISPQLAGWSIIVLLILAWLMKVAVGDTFAMTAIILTYHEETKGLEPNPEISNRLQGISDKFQELTERANEEISSIKPNPAPSNTDDDLSNVSPTTQ
ncbi:MAG: hypothetical protein AAF846_26610 [Chloroflexota bacterium]